jgi:hypothetical protein
MQDQWLSFIQEKWWLLALAFVALVIVIKVVKKIIKWIIVIAIIITLLVYGNNYKDQLTSSITHLEGKTHVEKQTTR